MQSLRQDVANLDCLPLDFLQNQLFKYTIQGVLFGEYKDQLSAVVVGDSILFQKTY